MALHRQTTLSKQTSQVFQMTLDELQSSVAGSGKLASMNLEEFLSTVWDQQGAPSGLPTDPTTFGLEAHHSSGLHSQHSGPPGDYSGKTVEEVWQAIQAGKGGSDAFESVTLGSFLQSVGLDMPGTVAADPQLSNLHLPVAPAVKVEPIMPGAAHLPHSLPQHSASVPCQELRLEDFRSQPQMGMSDGEVHAVATIRMAPSGTRAKDGRPIRRKTASPPDSPSKHMPAIESPPSGAHARTSRQRKRKEPEVVDERTARLQKRMVKNRESAARSRARKQEYTAQLEVQVAKLRQENRLLMEKVVRQCPVTPPPEQPSKPLRRTRTG